MVEGAQGDERELWFKRIESVLLSAAPQEIVDGMHFYAGAHGLCKVLHRLGAPSIDHAAGIYSALSPRNDWDSNVDDCFRVVRDKEKAITRTTHGHRSIALRILNGEHPSTAIRGRKTGAFWKSIAKPGCRAVPVDRHLARVIVGRDMDDIETGRLLSNGGFYARAEQVYLDVGDKYGVGNLAASVVWFVRRRARQGQVGVIV